MSLDRIRRDTADHIYENFDFSYSVASSFGWEYTTPGDEMTRVIFFDDPDDADADSIKGTFTVRFEDNASAVPVEAIANVRGEIVGNIMGGKLTDYIVDEEPSTGPRI